MKRVFVLSFIAISLCMFAAEYVEKSLVLYLKNGEIDIMDADKLSGIYTSYIAEDGTEKEEPQFQEFCDTTLFVERIPIEDIDSLVFGRSSYRKIKEGIHDITADSGHILNYENGVITYLADTPSSLLPKTGEKIVFEDMTDIFPDGLCAYVSDIRKSGDATSVVIREIAPNQIYDSYIACSGIEGAGQSEIDNSEIEEFEYTGDLIEVDDDAFPQLSRGGSRATVFDGQHSYRMKASVKLSSPSYRYDALKGVFLAKLKLTIDADYAININQPDGSKKSYSTGNEIEIPLGVNSPDNRDVVKSKLKLTTIFKPNHESAHVVANIHRKYAVTFIVYSEGDKVLVYKPEITPVGDISAEFGEDSYAKGSVSLMNSFTLDIRNIYNRTGVRAVVSTGPTLRGSIGRVQLDSMSVQHIPQLYEKACNKISMTASLVGFRTTYKNGEVETAEKITVTGNKYKSTATHNDGEFFFLPQFSRLSSSVSASSYTMDAESYSTLSRPVSAGCEVYDKRNENVSVRSLDEYTFGTDVAVHDYTTTGSISPRLDADQISHSVVRPLIKFADYIIKGPDTEPEECGKDGTHHPHAVDLGLPSGTQWACCNVGATTPEGYGGGFQFFSYFHNDTWDATWNKPTVWQVRELISKCRWVETSRNGVAGWKIYGLNGNSIFLPMSGFLSDDFDSNGERLDSGRCCYIWTGTGIGRQAVHCRFISKASLKEMETTEWYIEDEDPATDFCALRLVKN